MHGHLHLKAGLDAEGRTVLRRQSFAAPVHISKPHHDAGWLVVNVACPTPGLFAGDRVDMAVKVESGAHLLLTAPSASRIHTMREGWAELNQEFYVASGAVLDCCPEYLIPQAGARYRQRSALHVENGGAVIWTESLAPGRTASGEIFAFTELRFATDLFVGKNHVVRERYRIAHGEATQRALLQHFPSPYYASLLCVGGLLSSDASRIARISEFHEPATGWIGVSRLTESAWAVKILAGNSPDLRAILTSVRCELYAALGLPQPAFREDYGRSGKGSARLNHLCASQWRLRPPCVR